MSDVRGKAPKTKADRFEFFRRLAEDNPDPVTELEFGNTYQLLVAVVLSAQATDAGVNKATPALFALADTPQAMLDLGEERVRELIKSIGLFRTKARNVVALSRRLVEAFGGRVPETREELETLPGVGAIALVGGRQRAVNVVLDPDKLAKYERLSVEDVRLALARGRTLEVMVTSDRRIAVIGQGYVGLPLAIAFVEAGFEVTGVDRSAVVEVHRGDDDEIRLRPERPLDALNVCRPQSRRLRDQREVLGVVPTQEGPECSVAALGAAEQGEQGRHVGSPLRGSSAARSAT